MRNYLINLLLIPSFVLLASCTSKTEPVASAPQNEPVPSQGKSVHPCGEVASQVEALKINNAEDFKTALTIAKNLPPRSAEEQKAYKDYFSQKELTAKLEIRDCTTLTKNRLWMLLINSSTTYPDLADELKMKELFKEKILKENAFYPSLMSLQGEVMLAYEGLHYGIHKASKTQKEELLKIKEEVSKAVSSVTGEMNMDDYQRVMLKDWKLTQDLAKKFNQWKEAT